MKNSNKKRGFTIVELIIVIAVIAILAAVLIPTFSSLINKSLVAADESLVRNLNEALAMDVTNPHNTMTDALKATKENGFDVSKINARASTDGQKHEILWDSRNDCFVYKKGNDINYIPKSNTKGDATPVELWHIANDGKLSENYSNYLAAGTYAAKLDIKTGLDVGEHTEITEVSYSNTAETQDVVIRMNGGKLTVNDTTASKQFFYGTAQSAVITTGNECFYVDGVIGAMSILQGTVVAQSNSYICLEEVAANTTLQETKGGVFVVSESVDVAKINGDVVKKIGYTVSDGTITASGEKAANSFFNISNIETLHKFRSAINTGIEIPYAKLSADIDVSAEEWFPIGTWENPYHGQFDGGNHTIVGLTKNSIDADDIYSTGSTTKIKGNVFGFFGIVGNGNVTITNVNFKNVNIELLAGTQVGALIGYSASNGKFKSEAANGKWNNNETIGKHDLVVSNITVDGSIKGKQSVGGVIGRIYSEGKVVVSNCVNNADITATSEAQSAGIVGYIYYPQDVSFVGNTNNGKIKGQIGAAGIFTTGNTVDYYKVERNNSLGGIEVAELSKSLSYDGVGFVHNSDTTRDNVLDNNTINCRITIYNKGTTFTYLYIAQGESYTLSSEEKVERIINCGTVNIDSDFDMKSYGSHIYNKGTIVFANGATLIGSEVTFTDSNQNKLTFYTSSKNYQLRSGDETIEGFWCVGSNSGSNNIGSLIFFQGNTYRDNGGVKNFVNGNSFNMSEFKKYDVDGNLEKTISLSFNLSAEEISLLKAIVELNYFTNPAVNIYGN